MDQERFEAILDSVVSVLTEESRKEKFINSKQFETRVREVLGEVSYGELVVDFNPHPHIFPDICMGKFGVEVKFTENDTWRSVANSILESSRNENVNHIYVLFGKMGNIAEVKWGRYEECVVHVRTSHVPRFEVEINPSRSLFETIGISYSEFSKLPLEDKMHHIRIYARSRLKPGERLWWLEESADQNHSLPIQARLYTNLNQAEKRKLRAEATLLCPQVVKNSRSKHKYDDVVFYILTYHGILCHQARDLFSAGSVALRGNAERGGNYIERALKDIEAEMISAAEYLDDALFREYWRDYFEEGVEDVFVNKERRITEWLKLADKFAVDWKPSDSLFVDYSGGAAASARGDRVAP